MQQMVRAGEVNALVAERVWQELARGLMERAPDRMFNVLHDTGALAVLLPELLAHRERAMQALRYATLGAASLAVRFSVLQLPPAVHKRLRVPLNVQGVAAQVSSDADVARFATTDVNAQAIVRQLQRLNVLREKERLDDVLRSAKAIYFSQIKATEARDECDGRHAHAVHAVRAVRDIRATSLELQHNRLRRAARAYAGVDAGAVARACDGASGEVIKHAVEAARLQAVQQAITEDAALDIRPIDAGFADSADEADAWFQAITELLHRAYAPLAAQGFNYTAADQTVQVTRERLRAAHASFAAWLAGRCVGVVSVYAPNAHDTCELYRSEWHFGQFAVEPALQGRGIGERLLTQCAAHARSQGALRLALDTSEGATGLRSFYRRSGFADCGFTQHSGKSYRSVLMMRHLSVP
jgi:GNAT superfamily N-acetyltransferase